MSQTAEYFVAPFTRRAFVGTEVLLFARTIVLLLSYCCGISYSAKDAVPTTSVTPSYNPSLTPKNRIMILTRVGIVHLLYEEPLYHSLPALAAGRMSEPEQFLHFTPPKYTVAILSVSSPTPANAHAR